MDAEDSPELLRTGTGTLKRTGAWRVPSKLQVVSATGAVKLDFREAILNGGHVDIEVRSGTGAVDLILPAGATADLSGLSQLTGHIHSAAPTQPTPEHAHFTVHGALGTGGVRVAYKTKLLGLF
jgi:hypothetical protein